MSFCVLPLRLKAALFAVLAVVAAGCVAEHDNPTTGTVSAADASVDPRPGVASYRCDDARTITVDNRVSDVMLTDADGDSVTLPAAPPAQRTRYGGNGYALVLEGADALLMKGNSTPLSCRR
jgi:hypothetical protein